MVSFERKSLKEKVAKKGNCPRNKVEQVMGIHRENPKP